MLRIRNCIDSRLTDADKVVSPTDPRLSGRRNPSRLPRDTLYAQTLALNSPTSGGLSVGIVRSRTQATEFSFFSFITERDQIRNSVCSLQFLCARSTVHCDGQGSALYTLRTTCGFRLFWLTQKDVSAYRTRHSTAPIVTRLLLFGCAIF
jgi:hypothetical protein